MGRETRSEKDIIRANRYYAKKGEARVDKIDPKIRLIPTEDGKRRLIYSHSLGLDFAGILKSGKYISFEVKETDLDYLPIDNVKIHQSIRIKEISQMGGISFLICLFKKTNQYLTLSGPEIERAQEYGLRSIPIEWFIAFGSLVPVQDKMPLYLSQEAHPLKQTLQCSFPSWIKDTHRSKAPNVLDLREIPHAPTKEEYKARVARAVQRGLINARKRTRFIK